MRSAYRSTAAMSVAVAVAVFGVSPRKDDDRCLTAEHSKPQFVTYLRAFVQDVRDLVSESTKNPIPHETRVADSLPLLPTSAVKLVDNEKVCRRAIAALNRANHDLIAAQKWDSAKAVIVVRAGDVYVVQDPTQHAGEWVPTDVFDLGFTRRKVTYLY